MECAMVGILSRFHSIFMTVRHMSWNIHRRAPSWNNSFSQRFYFYKYNRLMLSLK